MSETTIKVRANPERGACLHEGEIDRFIGATIDHAESKKTKTHRFAFQEASVVVPYTGYYRRLVADGDLLAADAATAELCGVEFDKAKHTELDESAAKAKKDAVDQSKKDAEAAAKAEADKPSADTTPDAPSAKKTKGTKPAE